MSVAKEFARVKSCTPLFTTLHHSSLIARFNYHLFLDLVFIDDRAWPS